MFLQYSGLARSVQDWKKTLNLKNIRNREANPVLPVSFQVYLKSKKGTQDMYKVLNENNEPPSEIISWNKKYNLDDDLGTPLKWDFLSFRYHAVKSF